jgi:hypothetical protein
MMERLDSPSPLPGYQRMRLRLPSESVVDSWPKAEAMRSPALMGMLRGVKVSPARYPQREVREKREAQGASSEQEGCVL